MFPIETISAKMLDYYVDLSGHTDYRSPGTGELPKEPYQRSGKHSL